MDTFPIVNTSVVEGFTMWNRSYGPEVIKGEEVINIFVPDNKDKFVKNLWAFIGKIHISSKNVRIYVGNRLLPTTLVIVSHKMLCELAFGFYFKVSYPTQVFKSVCGSLSTLKSA